MAATPRSLGSPSRLFLASILFSLVVASRETQAAHGGHVHSGSSGMGSAHVHNSGLANPHQLDYNPGFLVGGYGGFGGYGFGNSYFYSPAYFGFGFGGFPPFAGAGTAFVQPPLPIPMNFGGGFGGGLNLPMPPRALVDPNQPRPRRTNPGRGKELVEIGDRSFRAKNIKRAEEKYNLAVKADPSSPIPHVHLAQVSVARGDYSAAADHLRDAVTVAADGAWLLNAPDIQAIFGEPGDFAKQLARLESHLQANPNDRDAWFVLGAESYLSGRTRQAFDAFQRLTDRRADEALTAFLDASRPRPAAEN